MHDPIASVIILTFNHEKYIEDAIDSVLKQKTSYSFEIIIADDCSTDSTPVILSKYQELYPDKIKVIQNKINVGPVKNYIQAFRECRGEYIAHCEGDDFWIYENKLEMQINFLHANPGYGLIHTGVNRLKNGVYIENINIDVDRNLLEGSIFEHIVNPENYIVHTVTAVMRKNIVEEFFDFSIALSQEWQLLDLPLWATIAYYSKVKYYPKPTACYRILRESLSHSRNHMKMRMFHESVAKVREYLISEYGITGVLKIQICRSIYLTKLYDLLLTREYHNFLTELKSILNYDLTFIQYIILIKSCIKSYIISLRFKN